MMKKFALLFALLVMPAVSFAQDEAAPPVPAPVPAPAPEAAAAVVVGQGCTNCGSATVSNCGSIVTSDCGSCGTVSACDPCARQPRIRTIARRNACCTPAPVACCPPAPVRCCCKPAPVRCCPPAPCCTPAPAPCCPPVQACGCGCASTPAPCCNTTVAGNCCTPAPRARLVARRTNCCESTTTACATPCTTGCTTTAPVATDCGCTSVASTQVVTTVAQVSCVSDCDSTPARQGLRPFAGTILRRAR